MELQESKKTASSPTSSIEQQTKYLRSLITGEIQQKVRLQETITEYKDEIDKMTDYIVDQAALVLALEDEVDKFPVAPEDKAKQLEHARNRLERHKAIREDHYKVVNELTDRHLEMVNDLQAHMIELSAIEISTGGFVAHSFGLRDNVKLDEVTKVLTFYPTGSVEVPIATDLPSWKDSSQMTIIKREGK